MKKMIIALSLFVASPALANCYVDGFLNLFREDTLGSLVRERQCTAEACDDRIMDLTAEIYILDKDGKTYYANIKRHDYNKTIMECRSKIKELDRKIELRR